MSEYWNTVAGMSVADRVHAGIALLDERRGPDWVHQVDPDALLMEDPCGCVLGQIYGGFHTGAALLDLDTAQVVQAGFDADTYAHAGRDFTILGRVWAYAIRRLRELRGGEPR